MFYHAECDFFLFLLYNEYSYLNLFYICTLAFIWALFLKINLFLFVFVTRQARPKQYNSVWPSVEQYVPNSLVEAEIDK